MDSKSVASQHRGTFHYPERDQKPGPAPSPYDFPPLSDFSDTVQLPLTDIRPSLDLGELSPFKLSRHCFTARRHPSQLHHVPYDRSSWDDEHLLRSIYFPEVEDLIQRITGCRYAMVTAAVVRKNLHPESSASGVEKRSSETSHDCPAEKTRVKTLEDYSFPPIFGMTPEDGQSPAPKVHLDFAPLGARQHIRKLHSKLASAAEAVIRAENDLVCSGVPWDRLKDHYAKNIETTTGEVIEIPRFALFSVWRPLKPVTRDPLGVAPCFAFPKSDYVTTELTEASYDNNIPAHLSNTAGMGTEYPIESSSTKKQAPKDHQDPVASHKTWSYLAYAPLENEGKGHDWHFISNQQPTEVLIIQLFDNEMEASFGAPQNEFHGSEELGASGAFHSSVELEGQEWGETRESIEVRCAAFW